MRRLAAIALAALAFLGGRALADPIPGGPLPPGPAFIGEPAEPQPVVAPAPPQHPFMAPNERSNIHDDAYMSDAYQTAGPLGNAIEEATAALGGDCGTVTFNGRGRIVTVCVGVQLPTLYLLEPDTLATLASLPLPPRVPSSNPFQEFSGGGYFYLDEQDRAVIPTTNHHIFVVAIQEDAMGPSFEVERDYDLSAAIPDSDRTTSALPDWSGRLWFVTRFGVVGTVDPASGTVASRSLGEEIENSFAVDETGGVFIVSDKAMYRFDADASGAPQVTWREVYPNSDIHKPGQVNAGSGTTPTLMGPSWVAITDNADPMDIVVYRRERDLAGPRTVCIQPVFSAGASDTENSLIGAGRAMIVENNYGYTGPTATQGGLSTTPGIERVDIDPDGNGCTPVWHSDERAPTVVPKLSLATGLVYTYTKDPEPPGTDAFDPWYLTALDFATGTTRWKRLAGTQTGFNNNYAPVTIGPDHAAYVGVLAGLVRLADTGAPEGCTPVVPQRGGPGGSTGRTRIRPRCPGLPLVR
ncbi:MAG TPA: hypothetical protein VEI94_15085 [Candidatus Bathyarchaeia archaeon]|nr:hypothetical protein [Candidatus Bathyarchaeia archaeon]